MDTEDLCRICLQPGAIYPIFVEADSENGIHSKLSECFSEKIENERGFPRNICLECNTKLNLLYNFIKTYKATTTILRNLPIVKTEVECENDYDSDFIWPDDELIEIKLEKEDETAQKILDKLKPLNITVTKVTSKFSEEKRNKTSKVASSVLEGDFVWSGQQWCFQKGKTKIQKEIPTKQKVDTKKKLKEIVKPTEKERTKLCTICGDILKYSKSLKAHMAQYHNKEKAICDICNKEYTSKYNLTCHLRRSHGEKSLSCSLCPKVFGTRDQLTAHIRNVHNKHLKPKKSFTCQTCNKSFKVKKSLVIHERSNHTGYRPAECSVCSKTFYCEEYLREHMRLHTGELPFKCPICGRGYTQRGNMKSHLRIHKVSELDDETLNSLKPNYLKRLKKC